MLKIIEGLPNNVLGISAEGNVSGEDYEAVLIPAVEEKLKTYKKIRMLYQLGESFIGFELKAIFDDAKTGMKHLFEWEKVALISDHPMINTFAKFFGYMLSGEVRIFKNVEIEEAKKWVAEK